MAKLYLKGLAEDINEKDGTLAVAVASDDSIDRDGEIVDPAGIDTKNFERNPVLLYAHDYRSDPIGKVLQITKEGNRMLFKPQFAVDINPKAKMYFEMFKAGILNAFSIGFIPKRWEDRKNADGSSNRVFLETELLEISAVPVPANPQALVLARSFKMADGKEIDKDILDDMEKDEKELIAPAPTDHERIENLEKSVADFHLFVTEVKTALAEKGEVGSKAPSMTEILRHADFQRGVLQAVDKALGKGLRDMNRSKS